MFLQLQDVQVVCEFLVEVLVGQWWQDVDVLVVVEFGVGEDVD